MIGQKLDWNLTCKVDVVLARKLSNSDPNSFPIAAASSIVFDSENMPEICSPGVSREMFGGQVVAVLERVALASDAHSPVPTRRVWTISISSMSHENAIS